MTRDQIYDCSKKQWVRRTVFCPIRTSSVGYTLWLALLNHPEIWEIARKLVTLLWQDINAHLLAVFWLMEV